MTLSEPSVQTTSPPLPSARPAEVVGFEQLSVSVLGRSIRYLQAGAGQPLVMVHGGGGLDRELCAVHVALAQTYRVLALEMPGWGKSTGQGIASLADLADVVAGFGTALELPEFALMGTSVGGAVALRTAIKYPDKVRALVLEAPAAFREGVPGPGGLPVMVSEAAPVPRLDPARVAFLNQIMGPDTDPQLIADMQDCMVPTLVMLGTADRLFGPRFVSDYKRLPVATVALVYNAGHDIKGDRPEAFLSIVGDFLARGPAFVVCQTSTLINN